MHGGRKPMTDLNLIVCDCDFSEGYELTGKIAGPKVTAVSNECKCPSVHTLSVDFEGHRLSVTLACHLRCLDLQRLESGVPTLILLHGSNLRTDGDEMYAVSEQPDSVTSQLKMLSGNSLRRINFSAGVCDVSLDNFGFENLLEKLPQFVKEILDRKNEHLEDVLEDFQYRCEASRSGDVIIKKIITLDILIKGYLMIHDNSFPLAIDAGPKSSAAEMTQKKKLSHWFSECLEDIKDLYGKEMDEEVERIERASRFGGTPSLGEVFHSSRSLAAKSNLRRLVEILKSGNDNVFETDALWPRGFNTNRKTQADILRLIQGAHGELRNGIIKIEEYLT